MGVSMKYINLFLLLLVLLCSATTAKAWTVTDNMDGTGTNDFFSDKHSTDYTHSNPNSSKFFIGEGDESVGIFTYNLGSNLYEGDELWVRVYLYAPAGFDWYANPITKLLRVTVANSNGTGNGYHSISATRPGNYGCSGTSAYGYMVTGSEMNSAQSPPPICQNKNTSTPVFLTPGQWHHIELYIKVSATNGIIRAWHDGILKQEYLYPTIPAGGYIPAIRTTDWQDNHILGWWNGGASQDQYIYFDDLHATNDVPSAQDVEGNYMIGPGDFEPDPINGVCGSADGRTFSSAPATNLCSAGTATTVSGPSPGYAWTCEGANGSEVDDSCSASYDAGVSQSGTRVRSGATRFGAGSMRIGAVQ